MTSLEQERRVEAAPVYLSVNGAATYTTLSVPTVKRMVASGELPSSKVGGRRVIARADIDRFLRSRRQEGTNVG